MVSNARSGVKIVRDLMNLITMDGDTCSQSLFGLIHALELNVIPCSKSLLSLPPPKSGGAALWLH